AADSRVHQNVLTPGQRRRDRYLQLAGRGSGHGGPHPDLAARVSALGQRFRLRGGELERVTKLHSHDREIRIDLRRNALDVAELASLWSEKSASSTLKHKVW